MAKTTGLGDNLYVGGNDLSGDVGSLSRISTSVTPIEVTGINKSAFERIGGKRDGAIEYMAYFNPSAGAAHAVLSALPTADTLVTYARGTTLGNPGAVMVAKQINYDPTRAEDGSFTFNVQALANGYGLEWGKQLTPGMKTDTTGTNGTGVDFSAATSFGWQAYLQVNAITGTNLVVTLEDSADNVSFATFTGSAFTSVLDASEPTYQRIASSSPTATVRQYVRAVSSGTFTSATFNVVFVKNVAAVTF